MDDAGTAPRVGMRVVGPDGAEIGTVSAVRDDRILVFVVPRRQLLPREHAIPMRHLVRVEGGVAHVSLTRAAVAGESAEGPHERG